MRKNFILAVLATAMFISLAHAMGHRSEDSSSNAAAAINAETSVNADTNATSNQGVTTSMNGNTSTTAQVPISSTASSAESRSTTGSGQ